MNEALIFTVDKADAHLEVGNLISIYKPNTDSDKELDLVPGRAKQTDDLFWEIDTYRGHRTIIANHKKGQGQKEEERKLWKFEHVLVKGRQHQTPTRHTFVMQEIDWYLDAKGAPNFDDPKEIVITGWETGHGHHGGGAHAKR
jgi:hypothetical protein